MKLIFLLSIIGCSIFALDIKLDSNSTIKISDQEANAFYIGLQKRQIFIDRKEVEPVLLNNRVLANAYLSSLNKNDDTYLNIILELEKNIADIYVRQMQKSISIDDDTLLSYYVSHKNEFIAKPAVDFTIFKFPTHDEGMKFFNLFASDISGSSQYVEDNNITAVEKRSTLEGLHRDISGMITDFSKSNYLLPPQFFGKFYAVVLIKNFEPRREMSFEESKETIEKMLYAQTFKNKKKAIVESILGSKK